MKKFAAFVIVLSCIFSLFAGTSTNFDPVSVSYTLYFKKPAVNSFFFSTPESPTEPFVSVNAGVQFPLLNKNKDTGFWESTAYMGIGYSFESPAMLSVWFNSDISHSDDSRMRIGKDGYEMSFLVGVGNDKTSAKAKLEEAVENNSGFDSFASDPSAANPVVTIYANYPGSENIQGAIIENDYGTHGKVFCMRIITTKSGMGGLYNGYVIMELTTL